MYVLTLAKLHGVIWKNQGQLTTLIEVFLLVYTDWVHPLWDHKQIKYPTTSTKYLLYKVSQKHKNVFLACLPPWFELVHEYLYIVSFEAQPLVVIIIKYSKQLILCLWTMEILNENKQQKENKNKTMPTKNHQYGF